MSARQMTREWLALLMESEAHNAAAERLRSGDDAAEVCASLLDKPSRYDDAASANCMAVFRAIAEGREAVE